MRIVRASVLAISVCVPSVALAQSAPPPPPKHEQTFEAAYVGVTGNAASNTFGLGADIIARPGSWIFRHKASFIRNESNDVLVAKSFDYLARAQKTINPRTAAFGEYNFFRDRFAGVVRRNAVTGGIALKAVSTATQSFSIDLGAGYVNEHRVTGDDLSSGSYLLGTAYKAKLSETAEFSDELRLTGLFSESDNWRVEHTVAITAKLAAGLSLKVSNAIRFANDPPPGFKQTDSVTAVAVIAKFARP